MKTNITALPTATAEEIDTIFEVRSNVRRRQTFAPQIPRTIKTPEAMKAEQARINAYWDKVKIQAQGSAEVKKAVALVQTKLARRDAFNKLHHRKAGGTAY